MKRTIVYFAIVIAFCCCPCNVFAELSLNSEVSEKASSESLESSSGTMEASPLADQPQESTSAENVQEDLSMCTDAKLGVKFLCNPEWKIETETNVLFVVIQEEPSVTMTIVKTEPSPASLDELTMPRLKEMGSYGDGIHVDRTTLNGESVVEVRGLSAKVPDLQLQDYYFIERNNLYGFLFSVQPAKAMASYEPLIEKIAGSLIFLPVKNQ